MRKMFYFLVFGNLFLIICWVVTIGIKYQFDFTGIRLDLYSTMKQFQNVYVGEWNNLVVTLGDGFKRALDGFDGSFEFVAINDIGSFFQNIGIWFNGIWNCIILFFRFIGGILSTIILYIYHVIRVIIAFSNFIFNPVIIRV